MPTVKKNIRYEKEQKEILEKILKIITEKELILYKMDEDEEFKNNIMKLKDDISKYYSASFCRAFNDKECVKQYLTIIKFILKKNNYTIKSKKYVVKFEDKKFINTVKYEITKNI